MESGDDCGCRYLLPMVGMYPYGKTKMKRNSLELKKRCLNQDTFIYYLTGRIKQGVQRSSDNGSDVVS